MESSIGVDESQGVAGELTNRLNLPSHRRLHLPVGHGLLREPVGARALVGQGGADPR
ncbi:unnamed protein product, partial [Linum tenue]